MSSSGTVRPARLPLSLARRIAIGAFAGGALGALTHLASVRRFLTWFFFDPFSLKSIVDFAVTEPFSYGLYYLLWQHLENPITDWLALWLMRHIVLPLRRKLLRRPGP